MLLPEMVNDRFYIIVGIIKYLLIHFYVINLYVWSVKLDVTCFCIFLKNEEYIWKFINMAF